MDQLEKLNKSQTVDLGDAFQELLNNGIFVTGPQHSIDKMYYDNMTANVIVHHWNHSKFLPMLFESFYNMDREKIDVEFIITDSRSSEDEINNIKNLLELYEGKLKIMFLFHNLDSYRKEFNENNPDGTFHGYPYISNSALKFCDKDIHLLCDSSNIVNKNWLRALCSPHYLHKNNKMLIKSRGGDFTAESTVSLENKNFSEEHFNLPHTYYNFNAGTGFGWSVKVENLKELGGFNQVLSCCGAVDDYTFYLFKLNNYLILGHTEAFAIHRIHYLGYTDGNRPRQPAWGYRKLKELCIINKPDLKIKNDFIIKPEFVLKNF